MTSTPDPMAEIRASFFIECEELLEALQDGLQSLEDGEADAETINVVFRAVHSIKGGAGAFGLEALVRFAHRFETALDLIRSGAAEVDQSTIKLFFLAADHLSDLIRISRDEGEMPNEVTQGLLSQLDDFLGEDGAEEDAPEAEIDFQPMALTLDLDFSESGDDTLPPLPASPLTRRFVIEFAPLVELFETGNEPFQLLRNLSELGPCETVCVAEKLPDFDALSPEAPYLSWRITLETEAEEAEIRSVFEFVDGLCHLSVTHSEGALPLPDLPPPLTPIPPKPAIKPAEPASEAEPPAPLPAPKPAAATNTVVRVDLNRIERLVNLVGELVINQAMLSQSLEHAGLSPHSDAMAGLEEFQRLTHDIQDSVMMIRAQPVKPLFQRMSRIVREASAAVGKDVRLQTVGEGTEVDKTVIERLADPLTHMIRNAVDHGLEAPEDRVSAGKSAQGNVTLSAAHRSGRVIIEIKDDGAGINRPRVQQTAIDKGLIPADATLSDSEIDNLLFMPGFSTASVVSDLSGRGVGMDVVRTAIQSLGGRISITSTPGHGSTFSISLPLTLAVLDGMVIKVAGETLVLPLSVVVETLTLQAGDTETVHPGLDIVRIRNEFVPILDLGHQLGYRTALADFDGSVALLIAQEDGSQVALIIDAIIDQRQVVIKGLDDTLYRAPGVAAATILGDGRIALILDTADIVASAQIHRTKKTPANTMGAVA